MISFSGTITGIQALQLAGANPVTYGYGGQGAAVCALDGVGHDADELVSRHAVRPALLGLLPRGRRREHLVVLEPVRVRLDGARRRRRGLALRHRPATPVRVVLRRRSGAHHRRPHRRPRRPPPPAPHRLRAEAGRPAERGAPAAGLAATAASGTVLANPGDGSGPDRRRRHRDDDPTGDLARGRTHRQRSRQ